MGCRVGGYDLGVMRHNLNVSLYVLVSDFINVLLPVGRLLGLQGAPTAVHRAVVHGTWDGNVCMFTCSAIGGVWLVSRILPSLTMLL